MSSEQKIKEQWKSASQGQVFEFWDTLDNDQKAELLSSLSKIDPEDVNSSVKRALEYHEKESSISPLPLSSQASVLDADPATTQKWRETGLKAIRENKVAVLLLAGGQGTRLGSSAPKGCYDIGLPSHSSLFQLQAERLAKVTKLAGTNKSPVWYIMTSGPTRAPTEQFFKDNDYFGLDPSTVIFFEQGVLPCVTPEGKVIMETPCKLATAPDGNGGVYKALQLGGILEDLERRGVEHVHMYCVDNSLVKVADPVFIGFAASHNASVATKVVRKRSANESVGLIVAKDDRPAVIEYSEISPELREARDDNDNSLLKFRAANIVNHYYATKFLARSAQFARELPLHVAHKKIPFVSPEGTTEKPDKPNGIKLEQFVFDVFDQVPMSQFACLEVARGDEFSPVKNGPGAGEDCPETARDDVLKEGQRWLLAAGARRSVPVEISRNISYGGEGLSKIFYDTENDKIYIH